MKKIILLVCVLLLGCSANPIKPSDLSNPDALTGKPIKERVYESYKKINNQLGLLEKLDKNEPIQKYKLIEHNNGVDARVNDSKTIPKGFNKNYIIENDNTAKTISTIDWKNDSFNKLIKNIANVMNYKLIVSGNKDRKINYKADNKNVYAILNELKQIDKGISVNVMDSAKLIEVKYE